MRVVGGIHNNLAKYQQGYSYPIQAITAIYLHQELGPCSASQIREL